MDSAQKLPHLNGGEQGMTIKLLHNDLVSDNV